MPAPIFPSDLVGALRRHSKLREDSMPVTITGVDGDKGVHIVKGRCSERRLKVSGPPDKTFRPGTQGVVVQHQGGSQRVLIAYPVGARGASLHQTNMLRTSVGMKAGFEPPDTACVPYAEGGDFVGIVLDGSDFYAWGYDDEVWREDLGPSGGSAFPTIVGNSLTNATLASIFKFPGQTKIGMVSGSNGQVARFRTWDYDSDTWTDTTMGGLTVNVVSHVLESGGSLYYLARINPGGGDEVQLIELGVGQVGASLAVAPTLSTNSRWCLVKVPGGQFKALMTVSGTDRVYNFDGSAFTLSTGETFGGITSSGVLFPGQEALRNFGAGGTVLWNSGGTPHAIERLVNGAAPVGVSVMASSTGRNVAIYPDGGNVAISMSNQVDDPKLLLARFDPTAHTAAQIDNSDCISEDGFESVVRAVEEHDSMAPFVMLPNV